MAYFYANNGLIVSTQLERLQRAFDVLASIFKRVSLRMNAWKTFSMASQPYHGTGQMSLEAYERWTTGTVPTFQELQRRRLACP